MITAIIFPVVRPGSPDEDGDRFIEIWNLVFMQYEQVTLEERVELPKPSIDTGMGLERIAAVLQGTHDNYATDLFQALIRASVEATHVPADGRSRRQSPGYRRSLASDQFSHCRWRAAVQRGQGLRSAPDHAARHAARPSAWSAEEPLMWRLVPALVREMGQAYPELVRAEPLIYRNVEAGGDPVPQNT